MTPRRSFTFWACLLAGTFQDAQAFFISKLHVKCSRTYPLKLTRDEYLQPHFEVMESAKLNFDRMQKCADSDTSECSLDEMEKMIEDLQNYISPNDGSSHATNPTATANHKELLESLKVLIKESDKNGRPGQSHHDMEEMLQYMRSIAEQELH